MNKKYGFLFPGQGAQYPGMAKDFYDAFTVARHVFEQADEFLGMSFSKLIFEGPSVELTLTKNSQIAIYISSYAILQVVQQEFPQLQSTVCAGLSLGEYTALTAANKLSFLDCLDLVRIRAESMHMACEETKSSMQVVLGLSEEVIATILCEMNPRPSVWIANLNCPGQVVIAGTLEDLAVVAAHLKEKGAKRLLPLDVSGAFHTPLMNSAQQQLEEKINRTTFVETPTAIVMNVLGDYVEQLEDVKRLLIEQVTQPVRWEKGIRKMMENDIDVYIEMGPGKSLSGMNKRIGVTEPTLSIEKVSDLESLSQYLSIQGATCNC